MPIGEITPCFAKCPKILCIGDSRHHFFKVGGETLFVFGAMEDAVNVIEDVFFGNGFVLIGGLEVAEDGVGDVFFFGVACFG